MSAAKRSRFKQLRKKLKDKKGKHVGESMLEFRDDLDGVSPEHLSKHYKHLQSMRKRAGSADIDRTDPDEYIEVPDPNETKFPTKRGPGDKETWSSWHFHDLVDDDADAHDHDDELDEDDDMDDEIDSEKEIIPNLPHPTTGIFTSPGRSRHITWNGKKHWLFLKEGVHIILDRLLGKTSPSVSSNCPVYGRLSRIEKRAAVLKYAAHLVLRKPFARDIIVDAISSGIYEACMHEALLESPEADDYLGNSNSSNKKRLNRIPFMQKVMGEAMSELLIDDEADSEDKEVAKALTQCKASEASIDEAIDRMRDIFLGGDVVEFFDKLLDYEKPVAFYNTRVEDRLSINYFLASPPEFDEQDERLVMEAIRVDEDDAGKETVFAANLKKALKLARQSMRQRQREKDNGTASALTAGVKETLGLTRDVSGGLDDGKGSECIGILLQRMYGSTREAKEKAKDEGDDASTNSGLSDSGDESWGDDNSADSDGKPRSRDWWLDQPWLSRHCNVAPSAMISALRDRPASWYQLWMRLSDSEKGNIAKLSASEACDVIDSQPLWLSLRGMVGCNLYRDGVWPIISNDGHLACVRFQKQNKDVFWYLDRENMNLASLFPLFISWSRTISTNVRNELRSMEMHSGNGRQMAIQTHLENAIATFILFKVVAYSMATHAETIAGKVGKLLIEEEEEQSKNEEGEKRSKKSKKKANKKAKKKAQEEEKKRKQEEEKKRKEEEERRRKEEERERQAEIARQKQIDREKRERLEIEEQIRLQEKQLKQHNNLNRNNMTSETETVGSKTLNNGQASVRIMPGAGSTSSSKGKGETTKKGQSKSDSGTASISDKNDNKQNSKPKKLQLQTVRGEELSIPSKLANNEASGQQRTHASTKKNAKQKENNNLPEQQPMRTQSIPEKSESTKNSTPGDKITSNNNINSKNQTQQSEKSARRTVPNPKPVMRSQSNPETQNSNQPPNPVDNRKSGLTPQRQKPKKENENRSPQQRFNGVVNNPPRSQSQAGPGRGNVKPYSIKTPPRYNRAYTKSNPPNESPQNPLLHAFSAEEPVQTSSQMPFNSNLFPLNSQAPQFNPLSTTPAAPSAGSTAPMNSGGWDTAQAFNTNGDASFGLGFGGTNWGVTSVEPAGTYQSGAADPPSFLPSYHPTENSFLSQGYDKQTSINQNHRSKVSMGNQPFQIPSSEPHATPSMFPSTNISQDTFSGDNSSFLGSLGGGNALDFNYHLGLNLDDSANFKTQNNDSKEWMRTSEVGSHNRPMPRPASIPEPPGFSGTNDTVSYGQRPQSQQDDIPPFMMPSDVSSELDLNLGLGLSFDPTQNNHD